VLAHPGIDVELEIRWAEPIDEEYRGLSRIDAQHCLGVLGQPSFRADRIDLIVLTDGAPTSRLLVVEILINCPWRCHRDAVQIREIRVIESLRRVHDVVRKIEFVAGEFKLSGGEAWEAIHRAIGLRQIGEKKGRIDVSKRSITDEHDVDSQVLLDLAKLAGLERIE
jgi:hypothetical protein